MTTPVFFFCDKASCVRSPLQLLQNKPLQPSSGYLEKGGSSETPLIATRLHAQENSFHYINVLATDFFFQILAHPVFKM